MSRYYEDFPNGARRFLADPVLQQRIYQKAIIHHYAMRSEADFQLRARRGTAGAFAAQSNWAKMYDEENHHSWVTATNAVFDDYLANYWAQYISPAETSRIVPRPSGPNMALHRPATQSSICEFSVGSDTSSDAARAVSGDLSGTYAFHTDSENEPWWQVDLGATYAITEVRVFNRIETPGLAARANSLSISVSSDGNDWHPVWGVSATDFGGIDGRPLIVVPPVPVLGRFVKLCLGERNFFHLHQVEVYGHSPDPIHNDSGETTVRRTSDEIDFDEDWYLRAYPDVAEAVRAGKIASGLQHYLGHGREEGRKPHKEGRKPHAGFDFGYGFTLQDDRGAFCMAVAYPTKAEADAAAQIREALANAIWTRYEGS
jgi:hypothetical protein